MNPSRRDFCLRSIRWGLWSLGAVLTGRFFRPGRSSASSLPDLAAVTGSPSRAARRSLEILGGMGRFVKKGQTVVVKPNIGWDRVPEQAANTNPEVVAEVVRLCLEAGAAEVSVFDRTCNVQRSCYRRSGIEAAVVGVGDGRVKVFHPDRDRYVEVEIPGGKDLKEWPIYDTAANADVFINVPVAKHHGLSGVTLGMKNIMGVIGGNRGKIHTGFDDKIVDLNLARPSHLTVIDATRVLLRNGPQGGRLEDVEEPGVVVASRDIVAADSYATRFVRRKPEEIGHIRRASERGLGEMDLGRLKVREEKV